MLICVKKSRFLNLKVKKRQHITHVLFLAGRISELGHVQGQGLTLGVLLSRMCSFWSFLVEAHCQFEQTLVLETTLVRPIPEVLTLI